MNIELEKIPVSELFAGYRNSDEEGVVAYGGSLNIRPKYQREFVYKDEQRNAVIDTVFKGYPLNVMYWVKNRDGTFEVLDGQQRSISICEYLSDNFSVNNLKYNNLTVDRQKQILNYELMVYFCEGTDSEKLEWFEIVNIAGAVLTKQELRNAVYTGAWLSDAKKQFSKTNCPAYLIGNKYLAGTAIRQDYLEAALDWISAGEIKKYMSDHQHDHNANKLWAYFQNVITWINSAFSNYRKEMKGIHWGGLYNRFKNENLDPVALEKEIANLMQDDDVTNKKGIYSYVLEKDEKHLNIRPFSDNMKREIYEKQKGICKRCEKHFPIEEMEGDHIDPWHSGGKTNASNCQMLCKQCNRRKSGK
ncbi:MAG: DUF262 domain-containing protein [Spirochaetes bacterium]|nr:DUF262 domain-containing protein [Spirochaetota bacterium]